MLKFEHCGKENGSKHTDRMTNSVDPDQTAPSHQDLHCLPRPVYKNLRSSHILCFSSDSFSNALRLASENTFSEIYNDNAKYFLPIVSTEFVVKYKFQRWDNG